MTTRTDIGDYAGPNASSPVRLVYTRKCGWIDLGHANPKGQGYIGASALWKQIQAKTTVDPSRSHSKDVVEVFYTQVMLKGWLKKLPAETQSVLPLAGWPVGRTHAFHVRRYLSSEAEQKSIALAIFLDVSIAFESLQSNWFYKMLTDSGFSAEDLVSNLIGFYRAVQPGVDYVGLCEPVSKDQALAIWDKYGPVGGRKNQSTRPILFPDGASNNDAPAQAVLPSFLNVIRPAVMGQKFNRFW